MITDLPGVRVGHATDPEGRTGCTVVLFPEGTVASGEVRGGAPATREVALLDPARTVARLDALVLSGGSAFGLAAADGVVRFCEERGMGVPTPAGPVPIVVGLSLFDLAVGDPRARPGPDDGYAACEAATAGPVELGTVGAGTGATVGTAGVAGEPSGGSVETADVAGEPFEGTVETADVVREPSQGTEERAQATGAAARATGAAARASGDGRAPGGLVAAGVTAGGITVAALVAVNAAGAPGADDAAAVEAAASRAAGRPAPGSALLGNTTIGVVVTDARLDKMGCHLVAQGAHDGLARSLFPAHTRADGDAFVAASVPGGPGPERPVDVDTVRSLAVHVVSRAVATLAD